MFSFIKYPLHFAGGVHQILGQIWFKFGPSGLILVLVFIRLAFGVSLVSQKKQKAKH